MANKNLIFTVIIIMMMLSSHSQNALKYQLPPKEILELADIRPQPAVRIDSRNQYMEIGRAHV